MSLLKVFRVFFSVSSRCIGEHYRWRDSSSSYRIYGSRACVFQTGRKFFCICICLLVIDYPQIELIVMARSDVFSVSSLAAVREVSNMKTTMTKAQAETALQSFVANGWLYKSEYVISVLSLLKPNHVVQTGKIRVIKSHTYRTGALSTCNLQWRYPRMQPMHRIMHSRSRMHE